MDAGLGSRAAGGGMDAGLRSGRLWYRCAVPNQLGLISMLLALNTVPGMEPECAHCSQYAVCLEVACKVCLHVDGRMYSGRFAGRRS